MAEYVEQKSLAELVEVMIPQSGVATIERQGLDEIAAGLASDRRAIREPPTWVQWAGSWLIGAVLFLMTLLLGGLLVFLWVASPNVTDFGTPVTEEALARY